MPTTHVMLIYRRFVNIYSRKRISNINNKVWIYFKYFIRLLRHVNYVYRGQVCIFASCSTLQISVISVALMDIYMKCNKS